MYGFEVYTSEVDDRGIDFVAQRNRSGFIEIQAKALRSYGYVFLRKTHFKPRANLYLAFGLMFEGQEPKSFLIPSTVWDKPDSVFVSRDYDSPELKSQPEWGINVSRKNLAAIEQYSLGAMLERLVKKQ